MQTTLISHGEICKRLKTIYFLMHDYNLNTLAIILKGLKRKFSEDSICSCLI